VSVARFPVSDPAYERADEAAWSGLGRSPTAERPEGLEDAAVRRIMFAVVGDELGEVLLEKLQELGWTWLASAPVCPVEQAVGCSVIPSP